MGCHALDIFLLRAPYEDSGRTTRRRTTRGPPRRVASLLPPFRKPDRLILMWNVDERVSMWVPTPTRPWPRPQAPASRPAAHDVRDGSTYRWEPQRLAPSEPWKGTRPGVGARPPSTAPRVGRSQERTPQAVDPRRPWQRQPRHRLARPRLFPRPCSWPPRGTADERTRLARGALLLDASPP